MNWLVLSHAQQHAIHVWNLQLNTDWKSNWENIKRCKVCWREWVNAFCSLCSSSLYFCASFWLIDFFPLSLLCSSVVVNNKSRLLFFYFSAGKISSHLASSFSLLTPYQQKFHRHTILYSVRVIHTGCFTKCVRRKQGSSLKFFVLKEKLYRAFRK